MNLTALFVKPAGPHAPLAIAVPVTPTGAATGHFINFLHEAGVAFHEDTSAAYIPADDMAGIFARLDNMLRTDPNFARGYRYMLESLVEEVDTFEEPLDTYFTGDA